MKSGRINSGCIDSVSAKCVTWNGPKIACLDICTGDSVSDVIHKIASKVCNIADNQNLDNLDLSCLIDLCQSCPQDKNLATILQLLLDNQCSLKELIDNINPTNSVNVELNLNLKCLKKYDAFENEIPQDLNQVLQSLIDQVCIDKNKVTVLEGTVVDLQNQIDDLSNVDPYEESSVTTCLNTTPKKLSIVVPTIASEICNYKDLVGQISEIQDAISRQCEGLNTRLSSRIGWINNPTSLSESVNNMWIALCDIDNRVKAIEQTCCAPSCDKIKLGFLATVSDNGTVDLLFSGGAGTLIPSGFVDCGSVITLTDKNGISVIPNITNMPITQDGVIEGINISSLATGLIKVNIKTKFCLLDENGKTIMTCQDCVNLQFNNTNGCCVITNTSTESQTIIYKITIES